MLTLAAIALVIPAAYAALVGEIYPGGGKALSISISLVLLAVYAAFLLFSLWIHSHSFRGVDAAENVAHSDPWSLGSRSRCSPEPLSRSHG